MSQTLTSSRGTTRSPSRGVRIAGTLLAVAGRLRRRAHRHHRTHGRRRRRPIAVRPSDPAPRSHNSRSASPPIPTTARPGSASPRTTSRVPPASGDRALVEQAEHAVDEAIRLRPDDLATYRAHGALELTLHQFAAAYEVGSAAHAAHPDSPDALAILVDASIELGRYDEAETHLRALLDRRPNAAALARVSYLREIHGDLDGARVAMSQAETAAVGDPSETATIATLVGDLALAAGEPEEALAAYGRAEAAEPGRSLTALGTARALAALDRTDEAIAILEASIAGFPEPALMTVLGELYEATGRTGEARDLYVRDGGVDRPSRRGRRGQHPRGRPLPRRPRRPRRRGALRRARLRQPPDGVRRRRPRVVADPRGAGRRGAAVRGAGAPTRHRVGRHAGPCRRRVRGRRPDAGRERRARPRRSDATPYTFPELPPIATELAGQLGLDVPPTWTVEHSGSG